MSVKFPAVRDNLQNKFCFRLTEIVSCVMIGHAVNVYGDTDGFEGNLLMPQHCRDDRRKHSQRQMSGIACRRISHRRSRSLQTIRRQQKLEVALALGLCCLLPSAGNAAAPGRGFPAVGPWMSFYGPASRMGDLGKAARTFRVLNIDADPGNFTPAQITRLKAGGRNRVLSYLNLGSMESSRTYWTNVPAGFVSGRDNTAAHLGPYAGYPEETWMDLGNADYQHLMVDYVAPRLAAQGVDGFYLDNLELVEHRPKDKNGPGSPSCTQGGLDLVRKLRLKYPKLLIVMQNATGDVTRLGVTGGVSFPSLLDGVAHEEVYAPKPDAVALSELKQWQTLKLRPGGRALWIATEDYVGNPRSIGAARAVYAKSRAQGFSPYASDASAGQQRVFYWPF